MKNQEKLDALIADLTTVARKHGVLVDKYSEREKGETRYLFKIQPDDLQVDIEEVFPVISHGDSLRSGSGRSV